MYTTEMEVNVGFIYDFTPAERRTFDSPGWPAEAAVTGVEINGVRLTDEQFKEFWTAYDKAFKVQIEDEILGHEKEKRRKAKNERSVDLFDFGAGLARTYAWGKGGRI